MDENEVPMSGILDPFQYSETNYNVDLTFWENTCFNIHIITDICKCSICH